LLAWRRGQQQDGVDIVGRAPWLDGKIVGAWCKHTDVLKVDDVLAEVKKAKRLKSGLGELLILTSSSRDVTLQSDIRARLSADPAPFQIEIVFWSDIVATLSRDDTLLAKYTKRESTTSDSQSKPARSSHDSKPAIDH